MEFVQEIKGYCEKEEEEVMEEERGNYKKLPFLSNSSSSPSSSKCKGPPKAYDKFQRLWMESEEDAAAVARSYNRASASASASAMEFQAHQEPFNFNTKLELSDLSLRHSDEATTDVTGTRLIEREHMFDKVVTPSDVGKLNRLVIPKQHAEKYFPLDPSSNEKGLLLNFEDRIGKPWRFRYSYWNSSQSYVMTKGWSRFVKEKKLDAGDIVSFERGLGELGKNHLYIDWKRRPDAPVSVPLQFQNQIRPFPQSTTTAVRWGRLNMLPQSISSSVSPISPQEYHSNQQQQQLSYNIHPYHRHHYYHHQPQRISYNSNSTHDYSVVNSGSAAGSHYYVRSQVGGHDHGDVSMVIDSVPVVQGKAKTAAKRLRLFGVNMECAIPDDPECDVLSSSTAIPHVTMASLSWPHHIHYPSPQLKVYNGAPLPTAPAEFAHKGKGSLSFDLDL